MLKLFSVYDSKAEAFIQPFFSPATGVALRSFTAAADDEGHEFHRFAGDYTLFEFGSFDPSTGRFDILETPLNLGLATVLQTVSPIRKETTQ